MAASPYRLRPSAAHRWVHCPGSVALEAVSPQEETDEQREGTAAHWVATELFAGNVYGEGSTAPNGVVVTDEMVEGAELFVGAVLTRIPLEGVLIEHEVDCKRIHPENGGTLDAGGISYDATVLHVVDYKFGHGYVEPFENWQCVDYLVGLYDQLEAAGVLDVMAEQRMDIEVTIVQPRNYHRDGPVRSWRVPMTYLRGMVNQLKHAAWQALQPNWKAAVKSGAWCKGCEAILRCEAATNACYQIVDATAQSTPFDLTPQQMGGELKRLQAARVILDARVEAIEVEALRMIVRGQGVPHFAAESEPGRLSWLPDVPPEEVIALGDLLDADFRKPAAPITPTQAAKALKAKGIDESVISAYAERPKGKIKLVPFNSTQTRKIFGGNANG